MDNEERKINIEDGDQQDDGLNKEEEKQENETVDNAENAEESEEKAEATGEEETDPLDKALEEIKELKEQLLYKAAEFDNFRRRTIKEKAELILNGSEKAVQAVLPVADDMERALENGEKTDDPEVLREGMELIYQKFMKALESLGVKKIDTTDADFDVDFHEAIAMVPGMGDEKSGKVLDCVQTGYTLNDKVIRHAKVAVGQR
ncbi:MAG: nucleotide exchange factor GrpE [Prevotella sp.]|nr:nucleotide exchange factor GrpE [Prevotella sp.]MBR4602876.1 nucleotide exchange factor GrpE [Prevotella sp.]MBR6138903.1 nucleotide exchange factor GrpE [Prevotella sp.]